MVSGLGGVTTVGGRVVVVKGCKSDIDSGEDGGGAVDSPPICKHYKNNNGMKANAMPSGGTKHREQLGTCF